LDHVIRQSFSTLQETLKTKKIKVEYVKPDNSNYFFDAAKISDVFYRILQNAIKVSPPESEIEIQVLSHSEKKDLDKCFRIVVSDQGPGIPEDELVTVFEKFFQSSNTKTGAGGRGLGLAICKEIIDQHQGKIWAENNPSTGASFYIQLPMTIKPKNQ